MSKTRRHKRKGNIKAIITSILMIIAIGYAYTNGRQGVNAVAAVCALMLLFLITMRVFKRKRLSGASLSKIDKMSGTDFEQYLKQLYEKLGYKVRLTPGTMDFGADLLLEKDGIKTALQAKRYKSTVGEAAVQQVIAAKNYYHCDKAAVVTNSRYTNAAKKLAKETKVILIDRYHLGKDFPKK